MKRHGFVLTTLAVGAFILVLILLFGRAGDEACPAVGHVAMGSVEPQLSHESPLVTACYVENCAPVPTVRSAGNERLAPRMFSHVVQSGGLRIKGADTAVLSDFRVTGAPIRSSMTAYQAPSLSAGAFSLNALALSTVRPAVVELPPVSTAALGFGAATAGGPLISAEWDALSVLAGESPSSMLFFKDFLQPPPINEMNAARERGAVPLVTWEPWAWDEGLEQPRYALDRIARGDFDAYLTQWGEALAAWGSPVQLRFAHEMNGDWYPWAEGVNGNQSGDYVQAWRHVHDVLARTGAGNVVWVWSPNVPETGFTDLAELYPGAEYVDMVALDGYNWGSLNACVGWVSPRELFGPGIAKLRSLAPGMPILIAETASSEYGGSKAKWNTELVSYLADQPDVVGFVWFHLQKEDDWRIDSSTASADAFRDALRARRNP